MLKSKLNNPYQESLLVNAQAVYYPDMVQIIVYKTPLVRHSASFDGNPQQEDIEAEPNETDDERSLRRSKKKIADYVLCNDFDMFITLTIAKDRQDSERSRKKAIEWFKNNRTRNGKFRYIVVPEYHKDGESLHFHALVGNFTGKIKRATNINTGKPLKQRGHDVYQLSGYRSGFSNVKLLGATQEDRSRVAAYIKKYITKDMPRSSGKKRYWSSKGLKTPFVEDNPELWYEHVKPDWEHSFDNVRIMRFNLGKNDLVDMFWKEPVEE